jgi:hypothetical protein
LVVKAVAGSSPVAHHIAGRDAAALDFKKLTLFTCG